MSETNARVAIGDRVKLFQRGKKRTWIADFFHGGRHCKVSLKTSNLKIARTRAITIANDIGQGMYRPAPRALRYPDAVESYLEWLRANDRASSTVDMYRTVLTAFGESLKSSRVTSIGQMNPQHLDQFLIIRSRKHQKTTWSHHGMIVKQFGKWLVKRRHIGENPFAETTLPKPPRNPKERPNLEQVNRILETADGRLRGLLAVLAFAGLRAGELRNLLREDVDLDGNWLHVVSRPGAETKTRTSRKIPIHPRLRPLLEAAFASTTGPHLFVAPPTRAYPDGGRSISRTLLNVQFQRVVSALGMPTGRKNGFVLHALRRFFETHAVNARTPQRVVDAWMGHTSDKSMGAVYYRLADEESQRFMSEVPFRDGPTAADAGKEVLS